jgi:imidazolonepropionase-like amidohydrolase
VQEGQILGALGKGLKVPAVVKVIGDTNDTLLPGLMDCHPHGARWSATGKPANIDEPAFVYDDARVQP